MLTPSNNAVLIAQRGQIVIRDEAGNMVCLTPELARKLAQELPRIAVLADGDNSDSDKDKPAPAPSLVYQLFNRATGIGTN